MKSPSNQLTGTSKHTEWITGMKLIQNMQTTVCLYIQNLMFLQQLWKFCTVCVPSLFQVWSSCWINNILLRQVSIYLVSLNILNIGDIFRVNRSKQIEIQCRLIEDTSSTGYFFSLCKKLSIKASKYWMFLCVCMNNIFPFTMLQKLVFESTEIWVLAVFQRSCPWSCWNVTLFE